MPDDSEASVEAVAEIDQSCRQVVLVWYTSGVFWLLFGTVMALLASLKLHWPEFLGGSAWLTFGRVRPVHLVTMAYGWGSMSGIGTILWLLARLTKQRLVWREGLYLLAIYWNILMLIGSISILAGYSTGVEWLEFPWWFSVPIGLGFLMLSAVTFRMLSSMKSSHYYISLWYIFGATIWFPILYVGSNLLIHFSLAQGMAKMSANWWFAHNVLGLWLTPIGLATVYYLMPKVIGRPVHSYYLSILAFWTLAIFYNWAGSHHLVGGPVPAWIITVGIVGSMMMFVPVICVGINHHMTMVGHFGKLKYSPTLRFTVVGAMAYTAVSVQGSLSALRSVSEVAHFTHYTIAHSHLGVYSFYTMVIFGAMYYIMPRLVEREWISAGLIKFHFWTTFIGGAIYFVGLSWGGVIQGMMMNDPDVPFIDIVTRMVPFLLSRSVAGTLMASGHIAFAFLFWKMLRREGEWLHGPTLFRRRKREPKLATAGDSL